MRTLNPYLAFNGETREAMGFYQSVFGGELNLVTYAQFPQVPHDPVDDDRIMHSHLETDDGLVLMAADAPTGADHSPPAGISLALGGDDAAQIEKCWERLADGGTVTMPLDAVPWGGRYGMVVDRFGVEWGVTISPTAE
jgi:PhnB protein